MVNINISWVNPKIKIKKTQKTGIGSFAKEFIKKGEILIVQGGRIMTGEELNKPIFEPIWYHAFQVENNFYICPLDFKKEEFDGIFNVNHSCDPTCGFKGQITMVSMKDITPDEQITFDYAMTDVGIDKENWKDMECLCKSKNCRRYVRGDDWKISELRKKYKGYFSTYVQELIDKDL